MTFINIIFYMVSNSATVYFSARADFIKQLYAKLFSRRKEAVLKNIDLLEQIYIKQDRNFIPQYTALVYLRYISSIKLQKEIELAVEATAAQNIFIEIQKQLTQELHARIVTKYNKK